MNQCFSNYDALQDNGVSRDFEKHWFIAHAFQLLDDMYDHAEFGGKALQACVANGVGCGLAITLLADLACLGGSNLHPLFAMTKECNLMHLEYCFSNCLDVFDETLGVCVRPLMLALAGPFTPSYIGVQEQIDLMCMDGDFAEPYLFVGVDSATAFRFTPKIVQRLCE